MKYRCFTLFIVSLLIGVLHCNAQGGRYKSISVQNIVPILISGDTIPAQFPGGNEALFNYIKKHTKYPEIAIEAGFGGLVSLEFSVNKLGFIDDIMLIRGVDPSVDREAIRVIKSLPEWQPALAKNKPVRMGFRIDINFNREIALKELDYPHDIIYENPLIEDLFKYKSSDVSLNILPCKYIASLNSFILDGCIVSTDLLPELDLEQLESVSILKNDSSISERRNSHGIIMITTKKQKDDYDIIVIEQGYESFLQTQQPKEFYSEASLKNRNAYLTDIWNYRCKNVSLYDPKIYEAEIDYNSQNNYGLDIEYKVYMFFRYMNIKYNLGFSFDNKTVI